MATIEKKNATVNLTDDDLTMLNALITETGNSASAVLRGALRLLHFTRAARRTGFRMLMKKGLKEQPIPYLDDIKAPFEGTYQDAMHELARLREENEELRKLAGPKKATAKKTAKVSSKQ